MSGFAAFPMADFHVPNKVMLRAAVLGAIAVGWSGIAWAQPQPVASAVSTPAPGSPTRRAILDALRAKLDIKSVFEVHHLKVAGRWAYLRCNEVVIADGEKQETDLTVAALFEQRKGAVAAWRTARSSRACTPLNLR